MAQLGEYRPESAPNLVELSAAQRDSSACAHTDGLKAVEAPTDLVCPDCVALGDAWVHLRICMSCGAVGCCDASKNKPFCDGTHGDVGFTGARFTAA